MNAEASIAYGDYLRGDYDRFVRLENEHWKRVQQRYCDHSWWNKPACVKCGKVKPNSRWRRFIAWLAIQFVAWLDIRKQ